jgi:deoxyribonuclease V
MRGKKDPGWHELVESWKATQLELRQRLVIQPLCPLPRFIAGADAAFSEDKQRVLTAAVIYDRQERRIIEVAHHVAELDAPYIPGFLSFREGPAVLAAVRKLRHPWGAICFDAHGYAHPRRCGLAAHMAIELDVPGIGVAKSRLIGTHNDPAAAAGSWTPLTDCEEEIGCVLRTRDGVRPIYVSIGHKVDLESARRLAMACVTKYRLPEPTRQADIEVAKMKRLSGGGGL